MRRAVLTLVSTVTGLVMLLSFKTHPAVPTSLAVIAPSVASSSTTSGSSGTTATSTGSSKAGAATPAATGAATKTVTGASVDTRWGAVQVQITVAGGRVTAAQAVVYPQNNPRDQQINSFAIPTLNAEAVKASSATIDMVSGATYTSTGYISSLQSALTKAGI